MSETGFVLIVPIRDQPGYYIGTDGLVRTSLVRKWKGYHRGQEWVPGPVLRIKSVDYCGNGHGLVTLHGGVRFYVHALVLTHFRGPKPFIGAQCRHLDGDPRNNAIDNLEWGTALENGADTRRHGTLRGEKNPRAVLTKQQVATIRDMKGKYLQRVIASEFGVSRATVSQIHCGRIWSES